MKDRLFIDYIGQEMMSFLEKIYKYGKKIEEYSCICGTAQIHTMKKETRK